MKLTFLFYRTQSLGFSLINYMRTPSPPLRPPGGLPPHPTPPGGSRPSGAGVSGLVLIRASLCKAWMEFITGLLAGSPGLLRPVRCFLQDANPEPGEGRQESTLGLTDPSSRALPKLWPPLPAFTVLRVQVPL